MKIKRWLDFNSEQLPHPNPSEEKSSPPLIAGNRSAHLFLMMMLATFLTSPANAKKLGSPQTQIERLIAARDFIGARILIRDAFKKDFNYTLWRWARTQIYKEPRLGYDLVFALEKHPLKTNFQDAAENEVNQLSQSADQLMTRKMFSEAYLLYAKAAERIRILHKNRISTENEQVYFYLLHQMARAQYATKNYPEALRIYRFLPRHYYQIRQVQLEQMWSAFYLNRIDQAVGSIVSLRSPYFSRFLEPEAYLVQLYVLRKLCRYQEANDVIKELRQLERDIKRGQLTLTQWARMDLETLSLFRLLSSESDGKKPETDLVNKSRRLQERKAIFQSLTSRFSEDLDRLKKGYSKILSFSVLSKKVSTKTLGRINQLPSPKVLYESGFEYWPRDQKEEWLDEFGTYYYIGESDCSKKG